MTPEQKQQALQGKIQAVATLMNQLKLVPHAEQVVKENGIIKLEIYYSDMERYPEEVKPEEPKVKKVKTKKTKNVKS